MLTWCEWRTENPGKTYLDFMDSDDWPMPPSSPPNSGYSQVRYTVLTTSSNPTPPQSPPQSPEQPQPPQQPQYQIYIFHDGQEDPTPPQSPEQPEQPQYQQQQQQQPTNQGSLQYRLIMGCINGTIWCSNRADYTQTWQATNLNHETKQVRLGSCSDSIWG